MSEISPEVEYEQKWEYLRHIEESRRKSVQLFFILIGGIGSYLAASGWTLSAESAYRLGGVILILILYSVFLLYFLIFQQLEYRRHLKRIDEMDGCSMGRAKGTLDDPFRWFLAAVVTTGAALVAALVGPTVYIATQSIALAAGLPRAASFTPLAGLVLAICAGVAYWSLFESIIDRQLSEEEAPGEEG